jgi:UDP-N-acetylmuramyl pentapeptide phosphotransferase/UDP-N-acetylglucosamine-1-phosphate transferase
VQHIFIAIAAGLLAWGLTGLVLQAALRAQHLAQPTARGLHAVPTPVGGGLGLIAGMFAVWAIGHWPLARFDFLIVAAIGALAALSWLDDRKPLPPVSRFSGQAIVVALLLWSLPAEAHLFPHLPLGLERFAIGFAWLWVVNLTNFMDGIDGLAGTEAITVGLGYALVIGLAPSTDRLHAHLPELAVALAAAAAGYLYWNWAPARIFMGDVGSIPLGFLFGLFMLDLGLRGYWAAALILPLYFLADATFTLLDRVRRGEKPWQAHREHAYQRAVLAGMSHTQVSLHIGLLNAALVGLAILSPFQPLAALVTAIGITAALIAWFRTRAFPAA